MSDNQSPRVQFDRTITFGDALKVAGMVIGIVVAWSSLSFTVSALDRRITDVEKLLGANRELSVITVQHEGRLKAVEDNISNYRDERREFENRMMEVMTTVREDLASLKALLRQQNAAHSQPQTTKQP